MFGRIMGRIRRFRVIMYVDVLITLITLIYLVLHAILSISLDRLHTSRVSSLHLCTPTNSQRGLWRPDE